MLQLTTSICTTRHCTYVATHTHTLLQLPHCLVLQPKCVGSRATHRHNRPLFMTVAIVEKKQTATMLHLPVGIVEILDSDWVSLLRAAVVQDCSSLQLVGVRWLVVVWVCMVGGCGGGEVGGCGAGVHGGWVYM